MRFTAGLLAALIPVAAYAQERADRVEYNDFTKPGRPAVNRGGTIRSESPIELVIINNLDMKAHSVPANEVIDVMYEGEPAELTQARSSERTGNLDRALGFYRDGLKRVPANQKFVLAHVRFKIAQLSAKLSFAGTAADRTDAIDELDKFRREFADSRQIVECLTLLGELLLCEGKPVKPVTDGFRSLRDKHKDHGKFVSRCDWHEAAYAIQAAQELFRTKPDDAKKRYAEVQTRLAELLPKADKSVQTELKLLLAECKAAAGKLDDALADLKAIIDAATEDRIRASAYLCRGDCYRLNEKHREATWDYLWVDVVYNQRPDQNAKALFHLTEVFKAQEQPDRERRSRERLRAEPFKATRWAKRAGS